MRFREKARRKKTMKKRLLMLMAVATLIVSSTTTALAAPSPEKPVIGIGSIVDKDGNSVSDSFEIGELAENIQESGKSVVAEGYNPFWFELCATEPGTAALMPIKATFDVAGVKSGDTVKVFYQDGAGAWKEATGAVAADGKVTVTLADAGAVVITVKAATTSGGGTTGGSTGGTTSGDKTSPTTGESNVMMYVALIGMVALAGAVIAKKKAN